MEENQIIEIWDVFKEYVPEKNREIAANHYVDYLLGNGFEPTDLEALMGYDPHLDQAIELVIDHPDEAEEYDDPFKEDEEA